MLLLHNAGNTAARAQRSGQRALRPTMPPTTCVYLSNLAYEATPDNVTNAFLAEKIAPVSSRAADRRDLSYGQGTVR